MRQFLALVIFCAAALAAPEGYKYKETANTAAAIQPNSPNQIPCSHISHYNIDSEGAAAAAALVQKQSIGRIVNQRPQHLDDHNLEAAASVISPQTQAITVNSHIVVGDNGGSAISGGSQEFRGGEGYVQGGIRVPISAQQLPPLPQPPVHFNSVPPPQFIPRPPAPPIPALLIAGQQQQQHYAHQHGTQSLVSQANSHAHQQYYTTPGGNIPRPPPVVSFAPVSAGAQYAQGYTNKFNSIAQISPPPQPPLIHPGPAPYRPVGPIAPGPVANIDIPRPVQHYASPSHLTAAGNYAGSFGHSTHGAQTNSGYQQFAGTTHAVSSLNSLNGQLGHVIRETFANTALDPSVEKHVYVHVPPEDLEEHGSKHINALHQAPPKKHYKIIFIKAPTAAAPNYAQLAAAAAPQTEEKTLVYVLVKKPDEPSFEELQQLQQNSHKINKPEVYFIKYKTRKEGEAVLGPVYNGPTQYNGGAGLTAGVSGNGIGSESAIDIRYNNGESNAALASTSTSNSYATSSSSSHASSASLTSIDNGPKHELYGVPLE